MWAEDDKVLYEGSAGTPVDPTFEYSSDGNDTVLDIDAIRSMVSV